MGEKDEILNIEGTDKKRLIKDDNNESMKKIVNVFVLILLVVLVFIAMFTFFFNMQEAILDLFNPRYQSLMQAVFALVVLVMGIYLIRILLSK